MSQPPYSNDPPPQQSSYGQEGGQPQYQQPYTSQPSQQSGTNGTAVAALITGIIALLLSWIPAINLLGLVLAIVAVVTGIIGMKKAGQPGGSGKGLAIGGLITGILAILVTIALYTFLAAVFNSPEVQQQLDEIEEQTQ